MESDNAKTKIKVEETGQWTEEPTGSVTKKYWFKRGSALVTDEEYDQVIKAILVQLVGNEMAANRVMVTKRVHGGANRLEDIFSPTFQGAIQRVMEDGVHYLMHRVPSEWKAALIEGKYKNFDDLTNKLLRENRCTEDAPAPTRMRKLLLDALHPTKFKDMEAKSLAMIFEEKLERLVLEWNVKETQTESEGKFKQVTINMNDAVEDKVFNVKDVYGPALAIIAMLMATSTLTWTQWHNAIKEIETRINKITRDITVVDLLRERKVKYKSITGQLTKFRFSSIVYVKCIKAKPEKGGKKMHGSNPSTT